MALLFLDSFDHYSDTTDKYTTSYYAAYELTTGRHGKGLASRGHFIGLAPASARCLVGGAWHVDFHVATFYTVHDRSTGWLALARASDGSLTISMFGATGEGVTSIVARSAVDVVSMNQWTFVELDVTMAAVVLPNGTAQYYAPICKVYVDGLLVIDVVDLGPALAGTDAPSPHNWNGVSHGSNTGGSTIDDFYISDGSGPAPWNAPLGDVRIDVIRPNGVGASTEWTPSGSPSNFGAVDDLTPDDDTTKVTAAAAGPSDLYQLEDINTNNGIIGAQLLINARRTEEGFATLAPLLRHAGTTTQLPSRSLSPSYFYRNRDIFVTMPNGDPLTDANVNALQAGFKRLS